VKKVRGEELSSTVSLFSFFPLAALPKPSLTRLLFSDLPYICILAILVPVREGEPRSQSHSFQSFFVLILPFLSPRLCSIPTRRENVLGIAPTHNPTPYAKIENHTSLRQALAQSSFPFSPPYEPSPSPFFPVRTLLPEKIALSMIWKTVKTPPTMAIVLRERERRRKEQRTGKRKEESVRRDRRSQERENGKETMNFAESGKLTKSRSVRRTASPRYG